MFVTFILKLTMSPSLYILSPFASTISAVLTTCSFGLGDVNTIVGSSPVSSGPVSPSSEISTTFPVSPPVEPVAVTELLKNSDPYPVNQLYS